MLPARDGSVKIEARQKTAKRVDNSRANQDARVEGEYRRSATILGASTTIAATAPAVHLVAVPSDPRFVEELIDRRLVG